MSLLLYYTLVKRKDKKDAGSGSRIRVTMQNRALLDVSGPVRYRV